jgi:DNA-binding NarL/FixJ family response regulator
MIAEAEKLGIADYILKPYTVLRLGNAVHAALTGGATAIPVEFLVNESIV